MVLVTDADHEIWVDAYNCKKNTCDGKIPFPCEDKYFWENGMY